MVDPPSGLLGTVCALLLCTPGLVRAQQSSSSTASSPGTPSAASIPQGSAAPLAFGAIRGVVTGPQGALMVGAQVTLSFAAAPGPRVAQTDNDGNFLFTSLPPGTFTATVGLQGFDPVSVTGTLGAGQTLQLQPFSLSISTVNVIVTAAGTPEELATEQMHAEEKQRLIGVLPNFFVSYTWQAQPLSPRQKFTLATKTVLDPGNLFLVGTVAGVQQASNSYPGYGQGAQGYGKRYGAGLGNLIIGTYMGGAVLPTLFRQDPRYFYKGTGSVKSRFVYAVTRAVICRGDNGKPQPAFASVLGDLSSGAISNLYYARSDRQGVSLTFENGLLGIAGDAMNDVFQEFVLKKLTPKVRNATSTSD